MAVTDIDQSQFMMPGQLPSTDPLGGDEYQDYFGFDQPHKYMLSDGKQWISFRSLNEGERAAYEAKTSRDVTFNRRTDDASIKVNAAEDRHALIQQSVTGWFMVRRDPQGGSWIEVPFDNNKISLGGTFMQWLRKADPRIVSDLHQAIVRANPWMTAEMTVAMVDEEIKRLEGLREEILQREAAQKNS